MRNALKTWTVAAVAVSAATFGFSEDAAAQPNCRWAPNDSRTVELFVCQAPNGQWRVHDQRPIVGASAPPTRPQPQRPQPQRQTGGGGGGGGGGRPAPVVNFDPVEDAENRQIQTVLNEVGCDAGIVDGDIGPNTRRAIECLQGLAGQEQSGELVGAQRAAVLETYDALQDLDDTNPTLVLAIYVNGGEIPADEPQDPQFADNDQQQDGGQSDAPIIIVDGSRLVSLVDTPLPGDDGAPGPVDALADSDDSCFTIFGDCSEEDVSSASGVYLGGSPNFSARNFCEFRRPAPSAIELCSMRENYIDRAAQERLPQSEVLARCASFADGLDEAMSQDVAPETTLQLIEDNLRPQIGDDAAAQTAVMNEMRVCIGAGFEADDGRVALAAAMALAALGDERAALLIGRQLEWGVDVQPDVGLSSEWLEIAGAAR